MGVAPLGRIKRVAPGATSAVNSLALMGSPSIAYTKFGVALTWMVLARLKWMKD